MSKEKEKEYSIKSVSEIPKARKERKTIYDDLLEDLAKKPKGKYQIGITETSAKSMYGTLSKRLRERKDMRMYMRGDKIFIERL